MYQTELNQKNRRWNWVYIGQFYQLFIDFKMFGFWLFFEKTVFLMFFGDWCDIPISNVFLFLWDIIDGGLDLCWKFGRNGLVHFPKTPLEVCGSKKSQMCHSKKNHNCVTNIIVKITVGSSAWAVKAWYIRFASLVAIYL